MLRLSGDRRLHLISTVPTITRNPQGLFEMRLAHERARIRSEATHLTRQRAISPIFSHIPAENFTQFASAVHQFDGEPVLRYSQRMELLRLAQQLDIRRFDANLIIASIERDRVFPVPQVASRRATNLVAWSVGAAMQLMLIAGVWWLLAV